MVGYFGNSFLSVILSIFLKPSPIATNLIEILSSFSNPSSVAKKSSLLSIFSNRFFYKLY